MTDDSLLTPEDLSAYLRIPSRTLAQWRWRGIGPPFRKLHGHVRYHPTDIRTWLDETRN